MAKTLIDKFKDWRIFAAKIDMSKLPKPILSDSSQRLVRVFVEGYDDVAFWRTIFNHFDNPYLRFEISVPNREDLPKGKKVLMSMIPDSSEELLLCVDSDFDYLFEELTPQSKMLNKAQYMFHTYAYATESFLCYAPSLHGVCVRATKNDTRIFDFVKFMHEYSKIIYPLFLWYAFSAKMGKKSVFMLIDFKNAVKLGYLDIDNNGQRTLEWLARNVKRQENSLRERNSHMSGDIKAFEQKLRDRGLTPESTYLFMHGHTLMKNVVLVLLNNVCEKLRQLATARITNSLKKGTALKNEMSNYTNSQRSIKDVLLDNENYIHSPLYKLLSADIKRYIEHTISGIEKNRARY